MECIPLCRTGEPHNFCGSGSLRLLFFPYYLCKIARKKRIYVLYILQKLVQEPHIFCVFGFCFLFFNRAGEPSNFFAAPATAPAPDFFQAAPASGLDFFPKRLRLLVFFFRAAPAPRVPKHPAPAPWQNILFPAN